MSTTLLVGVGGSGCAIAQLVHQRLKTAANSKHRYAILGIDTDTGDIRKYKNENAEFPVVQISSNRSVFESIEWLKDSKQSLSWLPDKLSYEILTRNLLDGAGQFRIFSRLAIFENMLNEQALGNALRTTQDTLFANSNDINAVSNTGEVDVMILGSIAGGTGSGIFLSVSLFLRDWLENLGVSAIVRGLFLLPNVFIGKGLPEAQFPSVRANAYASIKEIHAVMQATQGSYIADDMQFEYSPGKVLQSYATGNTEPRAKPFHYIYLLDGDAPGGRKVGGNIDDYYRMASDCAFRVLYTPLGANVNSIFDNQIRRKNADCVAGTTACFAALGVSGIIYPQEEMEQYLALSYSINRLSEQWLNIDKLFQAELSAYNIRKNAGDNRTNKPDQGRHYIKTFDILAKHTSDRFFRQLYNNIYIETQNEHGGKNTQISFEIFLDAFNKNINRNFWSGNNVNGIDSLSGINLSRLDGDKLESECSFYEQTLENAFATLESYLEEEPETSFRTLWNVGETTDKKNLQDYHLQKWLFTSFSDSTVTPHLLEIRYFLYSLRMLLEEQKNTAQGQRDISRKRLLVALGREKGSIFDDPDTEKIESPLDILRTDLRKNFFDRLISRYEQEFKENYSEHYQNAITDLKTFGNASCTYKASECLLGKVNALISVFETMFRQLGGLQTQLQQELEKHLDKHGVGKGQGDNYLYVFADREAKQALWDSLQIIENADNDSGINRVLMTELYKFYREQQDQVKSVFDTDEPSLDVAGIFHEQVIEGYVNNKIRTEYAADYQMPVVEAVRKQEILQKKKGTLQADANLLEKFVQEVYRQSQPFVDIDNYDQTQHFSLWGLSEKNRQALQEYYPDTDITQGKIDSTCVDEKDFPDNELLLLDITPGLQAKNLKRFTESFGSPGEYLQAYQKQSAALLREMWEKPDESTATLPFHLDYRWHLPGILPVFSGEQAQQLQQKKITTYLLGTALEMIDQKTVAGQQGFFFGQRLLVLGNRLDKLLDVISQWPPLAEQINQAFDQKTAEERLQKLSDPQYLFDLVELLRWQHIQYSTITAGIHWLLEQLRINLTDMQPNQAEDQIKVGLEKKIDQTVEKMKKLDKFGQLDANEQRRLLEVIKLTKNQFFNDWQQRLIEQARRVETRL